MDVSVEQKIEQVLPTTWNLPDVDGAPHNKTGLI
jgi:hypothetical protein